MVCGTRDKDNIIKKLKEKELHETRGRTMSKLWKKL